MEACAVCYAPVVTNKLSQTATPYFRVGSATNSLPTRAPLTALTCQYLSAMIGVYCAINRVRANMAENCRAHWAWFQCHFEPDSALLECRPIATQQALYATGLQKDRAIEFADGFQRKRGIRSEFDSHWPKRVARF